MATSIRRTRVSLRSAALLCAALVALAWLLRATWLPWLGSLVVHEDAPAKCDLVVVIAGDWTGERIVKAAELVKQGFAPRVLSSGSTLHFGVPECDLAIGFAKRKGFPGEWFECFHGLADSTASEARLIAPMLRERGIKSVILITNDAHTARARAIWRGIAPWLEIRVMASNDQFRSGNWWRTRGGWKELHDELTKRVTSMFGI